MVGCLSCLKKDGRCPVLVDLRICPIDFNIIRAVLEYSRQMLKNLPQESDIVEQLGRHIAIAESLQIVGSNHSAILEISLRDAMEIANLLGPTKNETSADWPTLGLKCRLQSLIGHNQQHCKSRLNSNREV